MKKELWLFTTRFPHGFREAFLENELPVLCERFERVLIFPEHAEGVLRPIPSNAEVRQPVKDPFKSAGPILLLRYANVVRLLIASLCKDAPSFSALRQQWSYLRARMAQIIRRADVLQDTLMPDYDPARVVVYSYWTHDWATVLGVVRQRMPNLRFFSRAHGFDIYEEQNTNGWIPFRSFQLKHVERVYCASRTGMEHLHRKHPARTDQFTLARLGTSDHGLAPHDPTGPLRIASCSFIIPRKRLLLLVEALALVRTPVQWDHFGGGEQEEEVRHAAARLPEHITVTFHGMMQNNAIMAWYQRTPVDVFVHLARLEGGVAVAIQEATSFGIPVIAADSGGVRELVNDRTGILLAQDPGPEQVAALLDGFRQSPMATAEFRAGVRRTWSDGFEARATFHGFVDRILEEHGIGGTKEGR